LDAVQAGPVRVLIAEDDPCVREALTRLVEHFGHVAVAVPDGAVALETVSVFPPDLVLSDITMPEVSGLELCRRLKTAPATRHIPVVLITGLGDEHRPVAVAAGADGFLNKPVRIPDLHAEIQTALRTAGREPEWGDAFPRTDAGAPPHNTHPAKWP
jgi:CheY-like chemotaxis protein